MYLTEHIGMVFFYVTCKLVIISIRGIYICAIPKASEDKAPELASTPN